QTLLARETIATDPQITRVNEHACIGCGKCVEICPFGALQMKTLRDGLQKAEVLETVCQGCGLCNATCPPKAIQLQHCTDDQILAELNALCA
ncbi:MAG: 4Fe-4S binding protein, partial [Syntrophobacteraceae bacterium]|nr:4Fe-4S binding protein [Syntrophobacteraceae bacterium]